MIVPPPWLRSAPFVKRPLRRLAKRFAPEGPLTLEVDRITWSLAPRDNKVDFDLWYKRRLPEEEERLFLAAHLGAGDLFVDIGANIGLYTVTLLTAVPGLSAVTFEPIERLRQRQRRNLSLNGLAERASIRPEAVGPPGSLPLYESRNAGRSSLIAFPGARDGGLVPVRPLATLLARPPTAIKIDVEGFEDAALMPWFDASPAHCWPRAVVIETLHRAVWRRDCLQEMVQRGYVLAGETGENALLARAG